VEEQKRGKKERVVLAKKAEWAVSDVCFFCFICTQTPVY